MNPFESAASIDIQMHQNTSKYSVILPTYNERKNLPVIVWLLAKVFVEKCVLGFVTRHRLVAERCYKGLVSWLGRLLWWMMLARMERKRWRGSLLGYMERTIS